VPREITEPQPAIPAFFLRRYENKKRNKPPAVSSPFLAKRGTSYYDKGEYDRAIADYTKAIELVPEYPFAYRARASAIGKRATMTVRKLISTKLAHLRDDLKTKVFIWADGGNAREPRARQGSRSWTP
jgi:tetratricopeptide (TPR) repeat protein